jgi:hypothetical protein
MVEQSTYLAVGNKFPLRIPFSTTAAQIHMWVQYTVSQRTAGCSGIAFLCALLEGIIIVMLSIFM